MALDWFCHVLFQMDFLINNIESSQWAACRTHLAQYLIYIRAKTDFSHSFADLWILYLLWCMILFLLLLSMLVEVQHALIEFAFDFWKTYDFLLIRNCLNFISCVRRIFFQLHSRSSRWILANYNNLFVDSSSLLGCLHSHQPCPKFSLWSRYKLSHQPVWEQSACLFSLHWGSLWPPLALFPPASGVFFLDDCSWEVYQCYQILPIFFFCICWNLCEKPL